MAQLQTHATYQIAAPIGEDVMRAPVMRHHRDSETFNTLDTLAPAVILEFEDFSYHLNSALTLPCLPSEPGDDSSQAYRWEDPTTMAHIDRHQPKAYQRFRSGEMEEPEDPADPWQRSAMVLIAVAYRFLEQNPDYALLIAGHTDTSGDDAINFPLSDARAANVLALLEGDRERWVTICRQHSKVADYQRILSHYAQVRGWDCDPGPVDNILGEQTRQAISAFQNRYNEAFDRSIAVDGAVGRETLGAFFDLYMDELARLLDSSVDSLDAFRQSLRFIDPDHKTIGCGERMPIEDAHRDNFRSAENRRVELLFFSTSQPPDITDHLSGGTIRSGHDGPEASGIYGSGAQTFRILRPEWWDGQPPDDSYTPTFEIRIIEEDLSDQHNAPDDEEYDTWHPETADPGPDDDPWRFLEYFDEHYPGYGGGRQAQRSRTT
ncbi:peptidoglycan-binding protein [Desulfosarcina ovata]|uniref:Peptidoglycan binding-like domain-containing protein n=1 Tax=Desulfosarcina ovata subsp. ovata TaxID=2752305 RepID=A0A5K8A899_9BACT|nr:peptidoglycan-binding protein [Desulfosarcina ovata]BBO88755.1 hypothetical protein DSCOOX_19350 [Desulfosarcina ovata subsp. ovata]